MRDKEQIITELEALALLVGLRFWGDLFSHKHLLVFIDNEGARGAILRGRSGDKVINAIAHEIALLEDSLRNIAWYSRVPSTSNRADAPSRMRQVPGSLPASVLRHHVTFGGCLT